MTFAERGPRCRYQRVLRRAVVGRGPLAIVIRALVAGIAIGELAHRRVDELRFKKGLFAMLLLAGVSLFLRR